MLILILLSFFAYPLLTVVAAARKIRDWRYQAVILAFCLLGAYIIIPYDQGDIMLYQTRMEQYSGSTFMQFINEILANFTIGGLGGLEIFLNLNVFIVSKFTTDVAVCYCLTAAVFFLAWRAIVLTLVREFDAENEGHRNRPALALIVFFSLYILFFRVINGRFYLAYWIFIYGFYKVVAQRKNKYHWLLAATIFVHQAFIFMNVLVLVYHLVRPVFKFRQSEYVLFLLIIAGTAFSETGIAVVNNYLSTVGGDFEDHFSAYTTDHYIEGQADRQRKWFVVVRTPLLFYSLAAAVLTARYNSRFTFDEKATRIYHFALILWAVNAFTINVPSFGDRFRNVLMGIFLLLLIKIYTASRLERVPIIFYFVAASFIFYKIVTIKMLEGYINKWLLYPFTVFLNHFGGPQPLSGG